MQTIVKRITLLCLVVTSQAFAQDILPVPAAFQPKPPAVAANSYILLDYNTNTVLAENNIDLVVEPASLTKMMTMFVVDNEVKSGRLKLSDEVLISANAWRAPGSRMFVDVNTRVKVEDLIRGVIIQSGNDASVALAEHIAGSEQAMADLMNRYAQVLGMKNTHFVNVTGLPDKAHVTTARDMAILARAIIKNFPNSYKIYSQKEFVYNGIKQINRNQLLWRNNLVDGIKTGHTDSAGYCLVASGLDKNMRLIAVVMGTKSSGARSTEANKLLTWGFRFYESNLVYRSGSKIQDIPVWMGNKQRIDVGFADDLFITTPNGLYKKYSASINMRDNIKAPLKRGDVVGSYIVYDENKQQIYSQPIVALSNVKKGNVWQRGRDYVKMRAASLFNKKNA